MLCFQNRPDTGGLSSDTNFCVKPWGARRCREYSHGDPQRELLARVVEWDVLRYSETKLSEGRTRRSPSERTATALAGEQGEARRGEAGGGTQANGGFGAYLYLEDIVLALADVGA